MIIVASFFLLLAIFVMRRNRVTLGEYFGYVWLAAVWLATFSSHIFRGFAQTDENYFADGDVVIALANRGLWVALNFLMSITTDDVIAHMRILNLFILFLLYAFAVRVFKSIHPIAIALLLSYFACVAALNLRDTLVFVALLMLLARIDIILNEKDESRWTDSKLAWSGLLMFLLRPFQLAIILVSTLRWYYVIVVIFLSAAFLQSDLGAQYFYNWSWHFQNFEQSVLDRGLDRVDDPRPTPANIVNWTARFVLAPMPWTSIARIFIDESYEYGKFDLVVRSVHRVILYSMFIYLSFQIVRRPRLFIQLLDKYAFVLKYIVMFSLIYAVFNFGGSHERIKMNVYLAILFIIDRLRALSLTEVLDRNKYAS